MEERWVLARRPEGAPRPGDFALERFAPPAPQDGEIAVRVEFHTVAPGIRSKLTAKTYAAMVGIGEPIPGVGVGVVEASRHPGFAQGDRVTGELGWASYCVIAGAAVQKLDPAVFGDDIPASAAVDVLGAPGLTAYFGLLRVGEAKAGDVVLVSSAAGSVGSVAGQIAALKGCDVVGIAGGPEKCADLAAMGFADAVDYKARRDLAAAFAEARPNGYDLYFDNVGGETTDAAILNMREFARLVICGQTSEYNRQDPRGLRNITAFITRRLTMKGFVLYDFLRDFAAARAEMAGWLREGRLRHQPTIIPGVEHAVEAFLARFESGQGGGRPLVKVI